MQTDKSRLVATATGRVFVCGSPHREAAMPDVRIAAKPFVVEHIKRRGPAPPKPKPIAVAPFTCSELLGRIVRIKDMARELRGVGRQGCEIFTEDKSDLHRAACRLEDDLRRRGVSTGD